MANTLRNEIDLKLGSKNFKLRASFNAICEIEDHFDKSLAEITINDLGNGKMKAAGLKAIILAGIRGAGSTATEEEVEEGIVETGIVETTNSLVSFLSQAFAGAPTSTKKK